VSTPPDGDARATPPWLVADTQVVLDWLVFHDAAAQPLLHAVLAGRLRWLATAAMRAELGHMLGHPSLAPWPHDPEEALTFFDSHSTLAPEPAAPPARRLLCSDADDQIFIDTALAHRARWLVTRDRALLRLRRKAFVRGLHIVRPAEWCEAVDEGA
jgi:predicted nucleic acid-binding protein